MKLSENIYRLRSQKGMSQGDLALALDVSRQSVSKWETGAATPELDKLMKMSELFGVSLDEMVGREGSTPAAEQHHDLRLNFPSIPTVKLLGIVLILLGGLAVIIGLVTDARAADLLVLTGVCCVLCGVFCLTLPYPRLFCAWCIWLGIILNLVLYVPHWEGEAFYLLFCGFSLIAMLVWTIWAHFTGRVVLPTFVRIIGGLILALILILFFINLCPPFYIGVTESYSTSVP